MKISSQHSAGRGTQKGIRLNTRGVAGHWRRSLLGVGLTLASVSAAWGEVSVETVLHAFSGGADGSLLWAGLVQGSDGNFYGVTASGGNLSCGGGYGCGTVFRLSPQGDLTTLYQFSGNDGAAPESRLIQASDGNFYGTTNSGGGLGTCSSTGCGTIFKLTPQGLTTLYRFSGGADGGVPHAPLVQYSDGDLYGTTTEYGASASCAVSYGCGSVFRITTSGALTTIYSFSGADGMSPIGGLIDGGDGNLYGTTGYGGTQPCTSYPDGCGTVYRISPAGSLATVHEFSSGTLGSLPQTGLIHATDGKFYGVTTLGGDLTCPNTEGCGTVYSLTSNGVFTRLATFGVHSGDTYPVGQYGLFPSGLMQARDGNFYGTTSSGANGGGAVFRMTSTGAMDTLYAFIYSNGSQPFDGVIQGADGNLYGTTVAGGGAYPVLGTAFKIQLPPDAPQDVHVVRQSSNAVILAWTAVGDATGYNVYVGSVPGHESATPAKSNISTPEIRMKFAKPGQTYCYTVASLQGSAVSRMSNEVCTSAN